MKRGVVIVLEHLEVLEAIVRTGSFAAAARETHRATSAVSYAVRALEESLGLELFDRSGHRAVLTPAGKTILEEARKVLGPALQLDAVARQLREGWEPRLEVVLDGIFPLPPVMRALKRFSAEQVPTQVRLMVEYLGGVRERFETDRADLMLSLDWTPDAALEGEALAPIEMVLVVHCDHPLAGVQGVTREGLRESVELLVADSGSERSDRPHDIGFDARQQFELSDFHSKREALLGGVGFGWLPMHLAGEALDAGELAEVDAVDGARYRFTPYLVHRRGEAPGRGGRLFLELLREEYAAG